MSLRYQINIRILLTSFIILIVGGIIAVWQARESVKTELDSSLNLALQLIKLNFPNGYQQKPEEVDAWLPRVVSLEQTRHLTIQLQQPDGQIVNFAAKSKQSDKTAPPGWFVYLISAQSPKIEQELAATNGRPIRLIIQANPIDEINEAWQESLSFVATLTVMTIITFLSVNLLFNRSLKNITVIVDNLKQIEQGNYKQKIPDFSTKEYNHIANAINLMRTAFAETHQENKALTLHSLQIQEEERQHLAKELHDELGQSLTAIKVMATASKNDKAPSGQIADTIISVCDHLISVVRSMMRNLHPLVLTELGLKASLEDLLNHWSQRNPELSLTLTCPDSADKLGQNITIQLFRIVQECLTNIIRHANASQASIQLEFATEDMLSLVVTDNGCGCTLTETKKGFGLLGIRERIKSLGGEMSITTAPQQGMKITAKFPIA